MKLLPRILSGTSAGSIIAAIVGVRTGPELQELFFSSGELDRLVGTSVFFRPEHKAAGTAEPGPPRRACFLDLVRLTLGGGPLFSVEVLGDTIQDLVGGFTFLEAFNRTGRILNIMVSRSDGRDPMLCNYITAPHVLVWSACRASSAVPGIFAPCELWARGPRGEPTALSELKFTDGCVDSDLPRQRLTELFNVNLFIVSQVNPAAMVLSPAAVEESGVATGGTTAMLLRLLRSEVSSYIRTVSEVTFKRLPFRTPVTRLVNLLVQEYSGDINVFPQIPFLAELPKMLDNPTPEYLKIAMHRGQLAVWQRASQIKCLCLVEFEMDRVCRRLQDRLTAGTAGRAQPSGHAAGREAPIPSRVGQIPSFNTLDQAPNATTLPASRSGSHHSISGLHKTDSGASSSLVGATPLLASDASYLNLLQLDHMSLAHVHDTPPSPEAGRRNH